jgi:hypothetical protein
MDTNQRAVGSEREVVATKQKQGCVGGFAITESLPTLGVS